MAVYQDNREQGIGNFVTPDIALLAYSLVREKQLIRSERDVLIPGFSQFLHRLDKELRARNQRVLATATAVIVDAQLANQQFVSLLKSLLTGVPNQEDGFLQSEFSRVMSADGIHYSEYWGRRVDYSQFVARGRYAADSEMRGYFKAYRYASVMLFALQPSASTGLTSTMAIRQYNQANALVELITSSTELSLLRKQMDQLLEMQFGPADDLSDADWLAAQAELAQAGEVAGGADSSDSLVYMLDYARKNHCQPTIFTEVVNTALLEEDLEISDVLTGWRLFPSRFTADKAINQKLVFPSTGQYKREATTMAARPDHPQPFGLSSSNGRSIKAFPSAFELAALLGNESARKLLDEQFETSFENYEIALKHAKDQLMRAGELESAHNRIVIAGSGLPISASAADRLSSLLAFQTWQRYLETLYAKQSYTPVGKSLMTAPTRTKADLEPAAELYLALAAAARKHDPLLESADWAKLVEYCLTLARLSLVRLQGDELADEQIEFLNAVDRKFAALSDRRDRPIVTDVHTDANSGQVVHYAVGHPKVVMQQGLRGARMSFHQFKRPLHARMIDDHWQQELGGQ